MRAMILAAGEGQRMGELTQTSPKALLKVGGRYLIEYAIRALAQAGIHEIVINVCYLKEQIIAALGNGAHYGVNLVYSQEAQRLETGGGIIKALPLLGEAPFIVLSADIISDYPLQRLLQLPLKQAHLVLVNNPVYHPQGDFSLAADQLVYRGTNNPFTFANIGIYRPELFHGYPPVYCRLAAVWQQAIQQKEITGECYTGLWYNVGTPQELKAAAAVIQQLNAPIF